MNKTSKKGMALLVALGFFASILAVMAPVGAAGGRVPVFSVTATFAQAGQTTTFYDVNIGGNLTINLSVTNAGDNTTTATVVLGYGDDYFGSYDLKTWSSQVVNNDTPAALSFTWEDSLFPYLPIYPFFNPHFWVNISDTSGIPINQSIPIDSKYAAASVSAIVANSSNAGNTSVVALGIDTLAVTGNITAFAMGHDLTGGSVIFYLDDIYGDPIGNVSLPTMTNNTVKPFSFSTNFSSITPAPSFGEHRIAARVVVGVVKGPDSPSNNFTIVEPKSDVILSGMAVDPTIVTITKGATVPVTITANLLNNGTKAADSATVHFYDGSTELNATITGTIAAQATLDVSFVWNVTDAIALGNHTVGIGVDTQAVPNYWAEMNITVNGVANVSISSFTALPASAFEGDNITLTVKLFNNGTADAVNLTVEFFDGAVGIGTRTNVSVSKGQEITVPALIANVGNLTADTNKTYKAKVGSVEATAVVTAKDRVPKIEITAFSVVGDRIGDTATFTATVKNNGTGDAIGLVVTFLDGTTSMNATAPFNLTVGSTKDVSVTAKLAGTPDANHTFFVQALGASKNVTKSIGHTLAPAKIYIVSMTVKPTKLEGKPKDSTQDYKITITLKNSGEVMGVCILNITEGKKLVTIIPVPVILNGGASVTQNYTWKVKGDGDHKAVATLSTGDVGTPATMEVKVTLKYSPGFEVLALVAAIIVAVILVRRRKN